MNPNFSRFIYMNMNYHIEHHMFPLVPYYNLPALHQEIKEITACITAFTPLYFRCIYRNVAYPSTWQQLNGREVFVERNIPHSKIKVRMGKKKLN